MTMTDIAQRPSPRSSRLGIRATPEQEAILKRAAEARHKTLTEFILDSACSAAGLAPKDQYRGQVAFVAKLAAIVGQNTLEAAYFGGAAILKAAFEAVQGEGSWALFRAAKGDRLDRMLTAKHTPDWVKEKIYQMNDLLDGWVSDADLDRIAGIWGTLESAEKDQARAAIQGRVGDLIDIGQRSRLRVILGS